MRGPSSGQMHVVTKKQLSGEIEGRCSAAAVLLFYLAATYSDSLRIFFRARFRAKACFTRRFAPGFR